jgi:TatD DNase family protein
VRHQCFQAPDKDMPCDHTGVIDTHCHLDMPAFDTDRDVVVARALAAGVVGMLVPAVRPRTWAATLAMARGPVRVALGIHPQVVPERGPEEIRDAEGLGEAVAEAGACAVGECGLDGATGERERQEQLFRAHIRAARRVKKPVVIHVLRALDAAARILREERVLEVGGVMHSYSGGADLVPVYLEMGLHVSFAGPVTYPNARKPLEAARAVPAELLLAETDAPDQSSRGGRSEPAFVADVIAALAAARRTSVDEMAALTTKNACRLFGFPP